MLALGVRAGIPPGYDKIGFITPVVSLRSTTG